MSRQSKIPAHTASSGKIEMRFAIRLFGAATGAIGFFLLAYRQTVLGTALVGIASLLIAVGE